MSERSDERRYAVVPSEGDGKRLDRFLVEAFPRYSRRKIAEVIRGGAVRINGKRARPGQVLARGDRLELPVLSTAVAQIQRETREKSALRLKVAPPHTVEVLYRDDDLLIVSKPPRVPVHGGARLSETVTLLDLLKEDVLAGFGLVHRIDRDTSGTVALVRGEEFRAATSLLFSTPDSGIEKIYEALVDGTPEPAQGEIDFPLAPPSHGGRARVDRDSGRPSMTRYVTLESFDEVSRLRVELLTGRTHQIRAHLAAIGHPLLVDARYGERGGWKLSDPRGKLDSHLRRTPLHASRLTLPHPRTGRPVEVEAPMAADIRYALEVLRIHTAQRREPPDEGRLEDPKAD